MGSYRIIINQNNTTNLINNNSVTLHVATNLIRVKTNLKFSTVKIFKDFV